MKIIVITMLTTILSIVLIAAPWVSKFYGPLSSSTEVWSHFGAYFGGVLSPIIAVLALIALLYTIAQQQKQINHLKAEGTKSDLFQAINNIEKDIAKALIRYPINIKSNESERKYTAEDVLFNITFHNYKEVILNKNDVNAALDEKGKINKLHPAILSFEMFGIVAGHINQLRLYVNKHDEVSGNNSISKYYERKYKLPCERLIERGMMKEGCWGRNLVNNHYVNE